MKIYIKKKQLAFSFTGISLTHIPILSLEVILNLKFHKDENFVEHKVESIKT